VLALGGNVAAFLYSQIRFSEAEFPLEGGMPFSRRRASSDDGWVLLNR